MRAWFSFARDRMHDGLGSTIEGEKVVGGTRCGV